MPNHATSILLLCASLGCSSAQDAAHADAPTQSQADVAPTLASVERPVVSPVAIDDLQSAFKTAIAAAGPGVVSVYSRKTVSTRATNTPFGPLFGGPEREFEQRGMGSGFVIEADGLILTNNHVVEGADSLKVKFSDGREFDAKVVGTDPPTDLALLRIEADGLQPLPIGNSEVLEVGDWVLAIGNPFGLPQTVSSGIVSAKGRANVGIVDYEDFIQTDAAVNPGNSGGPLVDLEGRVVGINTAIASRSGGNNGIAFAIPIDMAMEIVAQLRDGGKVQRGHLGIVISELDPELAASFGYEGEGILVQDVVEGGAAAASGVQSGDIITRLEGGPVEDMATFRADVARAKPGAKVKLEVWRDGKSVTLTAVLGQAAQANAAGPADEPPKLGIALQDITPQVRQRLNLDGDSGVLISAVQPGSPANEAGVRAGDVLEQVGGTVVRSAEQALRALREADLEQGVRLRVRRDGRGHFVFVKAR